MARRDVVDDILAKLEPWLEQKKREWQQQPEESREPTLPIVLGNKVNVRAIAIAIGLKTTDEQHFFKKQALADPINALARAQGLKGIGSRSIDQVADDAAREKIKTQDAEYKRLSELLAEVEAEVLRLREENQTLRAQLGMLRETGTFPRIEPVRTQ